MSGRNAKWKMQGKCKMAASALSQTEFRSDAVAVK